MMNVSPVDQLFHHAAKIEAAHDQAAAAAAEVAAAAEERRPGKQDREHGETGHVRG